MAKEQEFRQAVADESNIPMLDWGGSQPGSSLQSTTQEQVSDVYKEGTIDQSVENATQEQTE